MTVNKSAVRRMRWVIAELMTMTEVCQLAGVTRSAVIQWERLGKIAAIRVGADHGPHGGRVRLFSRSEVMCFIAERNKKRLHRELTA